MTFKTKFITLWLILFTIMIHAQAPQKMSYQAVVRNTDNQLIINKQVGIKLSILKGSGLGMTMYSEIQAPTTNSNGLVSIEFGGLNGFDTINWSNGTYFLKTDIDPAGGTSYSISGTSQLLSVPYALNANDFELRVSVIGDTLFLGANKHVIIPGISAANQQTDQNTVMDNDNNVYKVIFIGTQQWLAKNLRTTKYNDGSLIPLTTTSTSWSGLSAGGYCWMNNDSVTYHDPYGALYNWYAVNTGKLCPSGWHVPNDADWSTLFSFLGGNSVAGTKLKEAGTVHWTSPNDNADNSSGFTGLPGGYRFETGSFYGPGGLGDFWSATQYDSVSGNFIQLYNGAASVSKGLYDKRAGFSVRCLKN